MARGGFGGGLPGGTTGQAGRTAHSAAGGTRARPDRDARASRLSRAGGGGDTSAAAPPLASLLASTTTQVGRRDRSATRSAASLELASGGKAVMAIGGWSGSDPAPTLAQFEAYVAAGQIHYFIASGGGGGGGQGGSSSN